MNTACKGFYGIKILDSTSQKKKITSGFQTFC
jgi:hypothetical protein